MNDHDLLIRIDERLTKVHDCLANHLKKHWAISIAVISATLMGLAGLIVGLVAALV